jgi:hypothetical protein
LSEEQLQVLKDANSETIHWSMERFADREFRKHIPTSMRETWSTLRKASPVDHTGQDLPPWWQVGNDLWLQEEGLTPLELDWLGPGDGERHEDAQQRLQAALMKPMIYEGEVPYYGLHGKYEHELCNESGPHDQYQEDNQDEGDYERENLLDDNHGGNGHNAGRNFVHICDNGGTHLYFKDTRGNEVRTRSRD